jgi:predicted deacylase
MSADLYPAPRSTVRARLRVAELTDGGVLEVPVIVVAGRNAHPRVLVTAGVHGDEYEGPAAIFRLAATLDPSKLEGTVVLVPVANPPAFAAGMRTSPVDGVNLARIFPGDSEGTLSYRLAHALAETLLPGIDLLIDLHSGGVRYHFAQCTGYYEMDGPVGELSRRAAAALGLPYLWAIPPREGVLSYTAVRRGIPAVGAEVTGIGGCLEEDVVLYASGVLRVLDLLAGTYTPEPAGEPWRGDWISSPGGGFFEPTVAMYQDVLAGEPVAHILDLFGEVRHELRAPHDGRVLGLRHLRSIGVGEWAVMVLTDRSRSG